MRCDLHVHTRHSGMATVPILRKFCRECYSEPGAVYEKLKRSGMHLVTVTDHDSIDALGDLGHHPDFFLSEEVTCRMPSGTEAHIGVYDINERQHIEIQRRRNDMPSLLAYLREQDIVFSLNHPFSALTGRRDSSDWIWFKALFPLVEVFNGHLLAHNNSLAGELARMGGKTELGGSDAHTVFSLGTAFTEVPGARNRREFIDGLKRSRTKVHGEAGSYWKLTRDVLWMSLLTIREAPAALLLSPLILGVPLATLGNYLMELKFARQWKQSVLADAKYGAAPVRGLPRRPNSRRSDYDDRQYKLDFPGQHVPLYQEARLCPDATDSPLACS